MKPPKTRFLKNEASAKFMRDVVSNPLFIEAAEAALLSVTYRLTEGPEAAEPTSRFFRMTGAREYMTELFSIAEVPKDIPQKHPNDNLLPTS